MKLHVGSLNPTKVGAVANTVLLYEAIFPNAEVIGIDIPLEKFGHPKDIDEIVEGAVERAKASFTGCAYSFGIESGLFPVPHSLSGFMELQACAIYDGTKIHLGFAPAFEWPPAVTQMILQGEHDASAALRILGMTNEEKVGSVEGGAMGMLSDGRLTREEQIRSSIIAAMVQIEKKDWYL